MIRYNRAARRARMRRYINPRDLLRPLLVTLTPERREKALDSVLASSGYVYSNYRVRHHSASAVEVLVANAQRHIADAQRRSGICVVDGRTNPQTDAVLAGRAQERSGHDIIDVQPMKHHTADLYKQMVANRAASDDYYRNHKACPKCNGSGVSQTYVGYIRVPGVQYRDDNAASCLCGWKGTVHDLIPLPTTPNHSQAG